jgi:hypothetical protein
LFSAFGPDPKLYVEFDRELLIDSIIVAQKSMGKQLAKWSN